MNRITTLLLCFLISFYGTALLTDEPELLLIKSKLLFGGIVIVAVLNIIYELKNLKNN